MTPPGRWWRTVRPLRSQQWLGRARRVARNALDRRYPAWAVRQFDRGGRVTLRELDVAWPRLTPGPGMPTAEALLRGDASLLGQPLGVGPAGLPWHEESRGALFQVMLHTHPFLTPLVEDGRPEALEWARRAIADWTDANPPPRQPAWSPWCCARRVSPWLRWLGADPASAAHVALLGRQAEALEHRLELDLRGNHLWEDAVALVLAGTALEGPPADLWARRGKALLRSVFADQILPRGGHVERSAMYHALLLAGLLDLLAVLLAAGKSTTHVAEAAVRMAGWLSTVTPSSGRLPQLNDAAPGPAPTVDSLLAAAQALGLRWDPPIDGALDMDGWCVLRAGAHHLVFDAAALGPDDQPGHGHADTLGLEWTCAGVPVIADPGVAGYAEDPHRAWARSTSAHAALALADEDSAEVWHTFRVGRRPHDVRCEPPHPLPAPRGSAVALAGSHDGYAHLPGHPRVQRTLVHWTLDEAHAVLWIRDRADGPRISARSRLPFDPAITLASDGHFAGAACGVALGFGFAGLEVAPARVASAFGRWEPAPVLVGRTVDATEPSGFVVAAGPHVRLDTDGDVVRVLLHDRPIGHLPRPDRSTPARIVADTA